MREKHHRVVPPVWALVAALTVAVTVQPLLAQSGPAGGFAFLQLEPSARAAALGGSLSASYGDDINALFYNPSLLNETMHSSFSLSYLNHLHDVNAGFVAYGREFEGIGTAAIGVRFLSWGSLTERDETGVELGEFGATDVALTGALSREAGERIRYGVSVHLVRSNIGSHNAAAVAGDVGVSYHVPDHGLTLSGSVNNLGRTMNSLGTVRDELPLDVRIAASKRLQHVPLSLSLTAYNLNRPDEATDGTSAVSRAFEYLKLGAEFLFSEAFQIRFGYDHRRHEHLKTQSRLDLAGFGAGFGIRVASVKVDYAFSSWSAAGALHQFTVRTQI